MTELMIIDRWWSLMIIDWWLNEHIDDDYDLMPEFKMIFDNN